MKEYWYLMKRSWAYTEGLKSKYIGFMLLSLLANLVLLVQPWMLGKAFDAIQINGPEIIEQVAFWMALYALVKLLFWLIHAPSRVMQRSIAFQIAIQYLDKTYTKLRRLPIRWHQDHHSGATISRVQKASGALDQFTQGQHEIMRLVIGFTGPIIILGLMSWPLAVVALVINGAVLVAVYSIDKRIMYWLDQENEAMHVNGGKFIDYISNMKTIISLRLGKRTGRELEQGLQAQYYNYVPHVKWNEIKWTIVSCGTAMSQAIVIVLYIYLQLKSSGTVLVGSTIVAYRYLGDIDRAFGRFGKSYQRILADKTAFASAEPIENEVIIEDPYRLQQDQFADWQMLQLKDIYFSHGDRDDGKIEAINLDIKRGARIALVGGSGAGKSTLMSLIRGLYIPDQGGVIFDGQSFEGLGPMPYTTTLIPQDPDIFENSIEFNICVGVKHTPEQLQQAMDLAAFSDICKRLPKGIHSDIRERGVNLSGGEKQRLSVARGLFAAQSSSIVLMDEPTSSVDAPTERDIYQQVFDAFADKAIISSFHRLHLAQWFDTVVVMDQGRIVQQGVFSELVNQPGPFYDLWQAYETETEHVNSAE